MSVQAAARWAAPGRPLSDLNARPCRQGDCDCGLPSHHRSVARCTSSGPSWHGMRADQWATPVPLLKGDCKASPRSQVYEQWPIMARHAAEILGATGGSALFSMLTTAGMARLAGLPPGVARAMVPRSVTMALALPIAAQLDTPQPITAAAVALTGIAGSALVLPLLNAARFRDPIARGLAAAAAAHGLGTAALAAKEPEALPYCALAYAACGVLASLLAAVPPLRALLLAITG
ncbi:hypothetical protein ABPG75_003552 [Micractinium tetrahymenae]